MFSMAKSLDIMNTNWSHIEKYSFMQFPINFDMGEIKREKILQFVLTQEDLIVLIYNSNNH